MKFICSRTSCGDKYRTCENNIRQKPCEEAFLQKGEWVVDIKINDFIKKYGRCVLIPHKDGLTELEIYDTYRE